MGREAKRRVTKPFRRCGPMTASESRQAGDNATPPERFAGCRRRERMRPVQRMAQAGLSRSESAGTVEPTYGEGPNEAGAGLALWCQASAKPTTAAHKRRPSQLSLINGASLPLEAYNLEHAATMPLEKL